MNAERSLPHATATGCAPQPAKHPVAEVESGHGVEGKGAFIASEHAAGREPSCASRRSPHFAVCYAQRSNPLQEQGREPCVRDDAGSVTGPISRGGGKSRETHDGYRHAGHMSRSIAGSNPAPATFPHPARIPPSFLPPRNVSGAFSSKSPECFAFPECGCEYDGACFDE